jgi:RNA-directed DNA polymerase
VIPRSEIARVLAAAFLAGEWELEAMTARARHALGPRAWLRRTAQGVLEAYRHPPLDRPRELAAFIEATLGRVRRPPRVLREPLFHPAMGRARWPVPPIDTVGELADRLELDPGQLAWLADVKGLERHATQERLRNYRYSQHPRDHGPPRVIERPKQRLKEIQRWVLNEILLWIPVHDAAHGFVRGRSARTHAARHLQQRVVTRLDLEDFFAAVSAGRVYGIFRTAGYPEAVAHTLTGLCTNTVPLTHNVEGHFRLARRLATPHLPQGAPTSPALANLAAYRLDCRLAALGPRYTRYADDLVFSGEAVVPAAIARIAAEEGFRVNHRKTRVMGRGSRQLVTGIVVNERPNVARAEFDRLKATLHRASLDGPGDLDPAVLLGRIAWVSSLNPARGAKLRARFDAIRW